MIDTAQRLMFFPFDDADMSVRYGEGVWPNAKSDLLFREELVPVAPPVSSPRHENRFYRLVRRHLPAPHTSIE